jgi:hypothetical protein
VRARTPLCAGKALLILSSLCVRRKTKTVLWEPTNMPYTGHRRYPSIVIDNWSAAWKVRRHFEETTELRKQAGKAIF